MVQPTIEHDVKDVALVEEGVNRIEWAAREAPLEPNFIERYEREAAAVNQ